MPKGRSLKESLGFASASDSCSVDHRSGPRRDDEILDALGIPQVKFLELIRQEELNLIVGQCHLDLMVNILVLIEIVDSRL